MHSYNGKKKPGKKRDMNRQAQVFLPTINALYHCAATDVHLTFKVINFVVEALEEYQLLVS